MSVYINMSRCGREMKLLEKTKKDNNNEKKF